MSKVIRGKYDKETVKAAATGHWRAIHASCGVPEDSLDGKPHPCPVCGGTDRFNVGKDYQQTGTAFCRHCQIGGDGFKLVEKVLSIDFHEALRTVAEFRNVAPQQNTKRTIAESAEAYHQRAIAGNRLLSLAAELNVSVDALTRLKCGWNGSAWTFPETDAEGNIVGIGRRFKNGQKRHMKGHKRGLMIADDRRGTVYCIEGASDAAAMVDFGLNAIARPSANGGSAHLRNYLKGQTEERDVVIVAENDRKPNGSWPGIQGAVSVARKLDGLNHAVRIALPADGAKDVRDWKQEFPDRDIVSSLQSYSLTEVEELLPKPDQPRSYGQTDLNDIGNAEHFIARHSDKLRFCFAWKKWLTWDGARWTLDADGAPTRLAKDVVKTIFDDAIKTNNRLLIEFGTKTAKLARINAMITLAADKVPVSVDDLDANEWLLNCPNGTLDLRTGLLSDHERWQHITKLCPTEYRDKATCPRWETFLHEVFADDDLIGFVQRLLGYCLTGDVSEQKLPIFWGTGANGKSTLLNAVMDTVGADYTMQAMPDFLMERRHESHPTEKASLFGKRFVACVETEASRKLAESTVKTLTGGEKIMARRMREDFWEFEPTHKLILCTNHKPIVAGNDHAIWRRLLLVPFTQRFEGSQIDKRLPDKLRDERAGILAWLVRGCLDWQQHGLNPPEAVSTATDEYRCGEDIIGRFVRDNCQNIRNGAVRFAELFTRLEKWTEDTGDFCPSKRKVGAWLLEQGYPAFSANGRHYRGLVLRTENDQTESTERVSV